MDAVDDLGKSSSIGVTPESGLKRECEMLESREVGQLFLEAWLELHSGENCSGILSCSTESPECW